MDTPFSIAYFGPWQLSDEFLQRCPQLLAVSANGAGFDPIDVDACTRAGVIAVNQAGALDNVILSPHTAGVTVEASRNAALSAAGQWLAIAAGQRPVNLLNPAVWPRYAERFQEFTGRAPQDF